MRLHPIRRPNIMVPNLVNFSFLFMAAAQDLPFLTNTPPPPLAPEVQDFFHSLDKKPVPLYHCRSVSSGVLWKLPPPIDCPLLPDTHNSTVVELTLWWPDITQLTMDTYECYRELTTVRKSWFFFGSYQTEKTSKKFPLTARECHTMINKQVAPNGLPMNRILEGFFGTNVSTNTEYSWPYTIENLVTNYYYINLKTSVNGMDDTIITTAKITESCKYQTGVCPTEDGILIWLPGEVNWCRLMKGETTSCLLTKNRMSCPQVNLAITSLQTIPFCKLQIGSSKQGIYYTPTHSDALDLDIATTYEVEQKVYKKKNKRGAELPPPKAKFDSQINAEFQFLYETLRDNLTFGIQVIHREVCRSHQLELELVRALAEGGQASLMVRSLLRDRRYRARVNGDVLSVYKCTEIYEYMFLPQTNCTQEWPIKFIYNHDMKSGWLTPLSHEIVDEPTYVDCPSPIFIFDTGDSTIHLTNRTLLKNIPMLPSPSEGTKLYDLPDISFSTPGIYSIEDITGQETILGLLKQLRRQTKIDQILADKLKGKPLTVDQTAMLRYMQNFAMDPIKTLFYQIMTAIASVTILFFGGKFLYKYRYLIFPFLRVHRVLQNCRRPKETERTYITIPQQDRIYATKSVQADLNLPPPIPVRPSDSLSITTRMPTPPPPTNPNYPLNELHELRRL